MSTVMSHVHQHASGATGAGSVLLELGGDVGVLVLHAPAALLGHEIEVSRAGNDGENGGRTHALVRERRTATGVSYAAVYPVVPAGRYTVWRDAGTPAGTVTVSGGSVASFHWPV
jgi:hypothetical protein